MGAVLWDNVGITGKTNSAAKLWNLRALIAMVAPTITKDNFVVSKNGEVRRLDVGHTEGTNIPFLVEDISAVEDGGASVIEQIGHWFENLFSGK